jgi:hypothetical protein
LVSIKSEYSANARFSDNPRLEFQNESALEKHYFNDPFLQAEQGSLDQSNESASSSASTAPNPFTLRREE